MVSKSIYCIFAPDYQLLKSMKNQIFYGYLTGIMLLATPTSCTFSPQTHVTEAKENTNAKLQLQGLWMDDFTSEPIFQVKGDTIYYNDASIAPVSFKVIKDSLKTYGSKLTSYHIEKLSDYSLSIQSSVGEILHLRKAENTIDSISFSLPVQSETNEANEIIQKDRIVFYNDVRYRGYVYINPSQIKVIQPSLTDEGLEVDNFYYDNIIHICVYEGKKELFAKDIHKDDFTGILPNEFLQWGILSDMDFVDVTPKGYHYQATVCIPGRASCYLINLSISFQGEITYQLAE